MGQALAALALAVVVLYYLSHDPEIRPLLTPKALGDLGNMVLAFVILWTYMSFVQYLIIWMGNLAEETPWVIRRTRGGWGGVAAGLLVLHFFLPFLLLLFRSVKWVPRRLAIVGGLLVSQLITLYVTPVIYLYMEMIQEKVLNRIPFFAPHYEGHAEAAELERVQEPELT
jgi:hypothetical protein